MKLEVTFRESTNPYIDFQEVSEDSVVINDLHVTHVQTIPSTTWIIEHALNKFGSVTVVDDDNNVIIGEVHYQDKNIIVITFSEAVSGKAFIN